MKRNYQYSKVKILLLASALPVVAGYLPGNACAAEKRQGKGVFSQLLDGDVRLAPIGQRADLHMTFASSSNATDAYNAVHADKPGGNGGAIHLSVRLPLK